MDTQLRILKFVTRSSWVLLLLAGTMSGVMAPVDMTMGIIAGGLLVTINFHFMYRSLKKSLASTHLSSVKSLFAKHYLRFVFSIVIIYMLISKDIVDPGGLLIGLSVVVFSIMIASLCELKKIIFKEAV